MDEPSEVGVAKGGPPPSVSTMGGDLESADSSLVDAMTAQADDREASFDLDALASAVGATRVLLESVERAGLLLPHHVDETGIARYSQADVVAVRAGLTLLDAGLPLSELLSIASLTDAAVRSIAEEAVEVFLRFVRDPVLGSTEDDEAGTRLVNAFERMLPATERLVAHHLRRRLVAAGLARLSRDAGAAEDVP
jgi:DNA-binding transcriptional MerR regulator